MLFPELIVLVNLCEVFLMLLARASKELDIWPTNELSWTAWSFMSWFIFLNVANLLAKVFSFWSFYCYYRGRNGCHVSIGRQTTTSKEKFAAHIRWIPLESTLNSTSETATLVATGILYSNNPHCNWKLVLRFSYNKDECGYPVRAITTN